MFGVSIRPKHCLRIFSLTPIVWNANYVPLKTLKPKDLLAHQGFRLPEFISIKYASTGREGNNPHVAKLMSWIQHNGIVRQVRDGCGEPGHSHDPQDQRFSLLQG